MPVIWSVASAPLIKMQIAGRLMNLLRRGSKRPKLSLIDRLKLLLGAQWLRRGSE